MCFQFWVLLVRHFSVFEGKHCPSCLGRERKGKILSFEVYGLGASTTHNLQPTYTYNIHAYMQKYIINVMYICSVYVLEFQSQASSIQVLLQQACQCQLSTAANDEGTAKIKAQRQIETDQQLTCLLVCVTLQNLKHRQQKRKPTQSQLTTLYKMYTK